LPKTLSSDCYTKQPTDVISAFP